MKIVALLAVSLVASTAKPDAHDRAIVRRIDAQSSTFATLASHAKNEEPALQKCAFMKKKNAAQAFAGAIAVLPAILIQVINEYRPEFVKLRDLLDSLHPDSAVFAQWLAAERQSVRLLLRFDNGGKPIDLCKAGEVMLAKSSTAADVKAVLGIDPALIAKLFDNTKAGPESTLTRLKPKMRAFFIAAGLSPKRADAILS